MKRLLIAMHYMEIGGAESSLIGLLEALDPEKVEVDLFIYSHQGLYMKAIPAYVNLLPEVGAYSMMERPLVEVLKKGYLGVLKARLLAKYKTLRYIKTHLLEGDSHVAFGYVGHEMTKVVPDIHPDVLYDLAISYLTPHNFVLDHVRAKKKIAWIHTDYSKVALNTALELPVWGGYERIVSISSDVTKGFLSKFPLLADKILEMENILPKTYIIEKASDELQRVYRSENVLEYKQEGVLTLCSCGRISYAKNYDNIPYMAKALKELFVKSLARVSHENLNENPQLKYKDFRWYIVGPGEHDQIDLLSKELGVEDNVIFLGSSDNPYPYIKNCDIYVHPSRYEGKSIVVREAQVLCKPVIITNYPTAKSQINDGVDGVICEQTNEAVARAIFELAKDKAKQKAIIEYLSSHDMSGQSEVNKVYGLL